MSSDLTPGRWQSKTLSTIDERGSNIDRNIVFDCHLSPVRWQMAIGNSVSYQIFDQRSSIVLAFSIATIKNTVLSIFDPRSSIVDSVFDCRLPRVMLFTLTKFCVLHLQCSLPMLTIFRSLSVLWDRMDFNDRNQLMTAKLFIKAIIFVFYMFYALKQHTRFTWCYLDLSLRACWGRCRLRMLPCVWQWIKEYVLSETTMIKEYKLIDWSSIKDSSIRISPNVHDK